MAVSPKAGRQTLAEIALFAVLFLFFLQLLTTFIESTYAFGLLQTGIPYEAAAILLLFSPLALLFFKRRDPERALLLTGELLLLFRMPLAVLVDTRGKMLLAGAGTALFLVFFPLLLWRLGRKGDSAGALRLGAGLVTGAALNILLRTVNSGNDITEFGMFRYLAWALAIGAGLLLPYVLRQTDIPDVKAPPVPRRGSAVRAAGLCLGIISVFALLYFAFAAPGVIARWSGADGLRSVFLIVPAFGLLTAASVLRHPGWLTPVLVTVWNLLFTVTLALGLRGFQVSFPTNPGSYPIYQFMDGTMESAGPVILLLVATALHPVLYLDFVLLVRELQSEAPSIRTLGWGFSLGSLYLLALILAQVFTTVYDYVPVLGPLMRDRFWLTAAAPALALLLGILMVSEAGYRLPARLPRVRPLTALSIVLILAFSPAAAVWTTEIYTAPPRFTIEQLRVLTYNVQQGYNAAGQKALEQQLEAIRAQNPVIVALEESDMARAANGNSDVVRFAADKLHMYAYYGPRTTTGTFGIALLSRYPIRNPQTFYMYSVGEQTAAIQAQIDVNGKTFNIFVTHLGNGGPIIQQQQVLQAANGLDNVILMGDFNFRPNGEQYLATVDRLDDAWLEADQHIVTPTSLNPGQRIDHVFISPGLDVTRAAYLDPGASDHPMMVVDIPLQ